MAGQWGIYSSFIIDSATFLLSAVFLVKINSQNLHISGESDKTISAAIDDYITGLRYLLDNRRCLNSFSSKGSRILLPRVLFKLFKYI